jgi:hypothetical protein
MPRGVEGSDSELNNLMLDKQTISILKYIRNNLAHANLITKEQVAKYMDEKQICSRPTTLKIIQRLLDHKIIMNDKQRDNTFSRLIIDPSFDFAAVELTLLTTCIDKIHFHFQDFANETKGVNTILIKNLQDAIEDFYTKKQSQSTKLRPEPRITKK